MPFCDSLTRFRVFNRTGPLPAAPAGWEWPDLMRIALGEAGDASQNGDVPVGALIVAPGGRILARAANGVERLHDPTAHAEIRALKKAAIIQGSSQLCNCVLVVTLEPCLMCVGACAHARLAGIVYGAYDSRPSSSLSLLLIIFASFRLNR